MATSDPSELFKAPKFRQLLALVFMIWLGLSICVAVSFLSPLPLDLTDPIVTPFSYLVLFGGCSSWVFWQYHHRHIDIQGILGIWPTPLRWKRIVGLWLLLFLFSIGTFQVSFVALSYVFPEFIQDILQDSIFLGPGESALPWLYNGLMGFILVVAAPVLEEFLFRGFLLHRWGVRWNVHTAVVFSSLLFGVLHSNVIGLTMFGVVMALLYLRSHSLGLVIAVHSLNNAVAASLEILTRLTGAPTTQTLETFRGSLWVGMILLAIATPFLIRFLRQNWALTQGPLPYVANQNHLTVS